MQKRPSRTSNLSRLFTLFLAGVLVLVVILVLFSLSIVFFLRKTPHREFFFCGKIHALCKKQSNSIEVSIAKIIVRLGGKEFSYAHAAHVHKDFKKAQT